jgi:hypothetical protein
MGMYCTFKNRLDGTVTISVCEKVYYNLEVLKKKYLHTLRLVSSQCSRSWLTEKKDTINFKLISGLI